MNENSGRLYPGMRWAYDSAGSQVLAALVEKLAGKPLFDFLYDRIFRQLGAFNTASILQTKNGNSWGDSALLCTTRDMVSFARIFAFRPGYGYAASVDPKPDVPAPDDDGIFLTDMETGISKLLNDIRCDLHNLFAFDGKYISYDTTENNCRQIALIPIDILNF